MKVIKCDFCGEVIENNKFQIRKEYLDITFNWSWAYYDICKSCVNTLRKMRKKEIAGEEG